MGLTQTKQILKIFLLGITLFQSSLGSRLCRDAFLYWEPHGRCYPAESRGPCPPGQILIDKPEGPICIKDYRFRVQTLKDHIRHRPSDNDIENSFISKRRDFPSFTLQNGVHFPRKYSLPSMYSMSYKERECLENFEVYWEPKGRCFPLLSSEACERPEEWLVLTKESGRLELECKEKACPCRDLDLCEVEVAGRHSNDCQKCIVSRAAHQHSICKENEQLYINPFGVGKCGCLRDPLHVRFEGKCYPLFSQGPCQDGHSLQYSSLTQTTACSPELCPDTGVLHEDGHCYFLGTKGPCQDGEYYDVLPDTKSLECRKYENKRDRIRETHHRSPMKRVFDIIPKDGQPPGCVVDSRGTCRDIIDFDDSRIGKRQNSRSIKFLRGSQQLEQKLMVPIPENVRTAEDFVNWLNNSNDHSDLF